ncbi:hypothetical protein FRC14_002600 [Serendipita sp. 396]|nr:hypothetical protein FRC14_002600 [Serendipita sp. 396]KAG8768741.1 hypothetical protein FRC15_004994 [Serendipita sp. 397]KAG8841629.1 hypothetical protein FRC20_004916 [Serendipita sp. 405]
MLSDTTTTTVTSLSLPLSGSPAHKPVIYSPNDLLQLAPSPFSSSSASSSSSSASASTASSNQPSPFSLTFSLPSSLQLPPPSSISQQLLLSRLQNFPDILAPSAAEALAAATNPSESDTATTGNGSGSLSLFDVPVEDEEEEEEGEESNKDEDSEDGDGEDEDGEEEEEEDGFVYGESRFNKRDDLGFHEVEMLKKAVRYALVGGRGRRTAVVWQAQTPRTPSRAASPVRKVETPTAGEEIPVRVVVDGRKESAVANGTTVAVEVGKPTNRPLIVHTNSSTQPPVLVTRPSNSRRNSRSRSGTLSLFSNGERGGVGGGNGNGNGGGGIAHPARQGMGVWRSRTLMARMANQQQQYQQQNQRQHQQKLQTIRSGSVLVDPKKTSVRNATGAGAEEAMSWRRLERGSEWKWNERSGSYVVVKV